MASFVQRFGKLVEADEVFSAWNSGDLNQMLSVLDIGTNLIDRHHLLHCIVETTYKQRSKLAMRKQCKEVAEMHISEFSEISKALGKEFGSLPRVATFQYYETLLTEDAQYSKAIEVCELALDYGLEDGTKSGFKGRIRRIKKAEAKAL